MELNRISIYNFRSIKEAKVKFDHNCLVLLGKNEAGKSNVLKAIAAVFGAYKVSDKDKRKRIDNEKITDYKIMSVFETSQSDRDRVIQRLSKIYSNIGIVKFKNGYTLDEYLKNNFSELVIKIDIGDDKKKHCSYWVYNEEEYSFEKKLYVVGNNLTEDSNGSLFNLGSVVVDLLEEIYNENPYNCHFWQFKDTYMLPNSVDINDFIANPNEIKGLENLFVLCGREDISKEFSEAMKQDGDYANMLEQISDTVTSTFQKIWKDFNNTRIQLQPNGDEILIKVINKAKYSFEDRSDGFKKFISILLMLSSPSRANKMKDRDIILIDEPDQSLYPTSAQYLRDELLDMSKRSKIIYSTHSQYMIDSSCIERHIVVEKENDITTLKKESENSPFSDDELLRRAIGTSIFECLKEKNIIFEGYLDKELFKKYSSYHKLNNEYKDYGIVYLAGISGVETLTQILMMANKKFVVVADSDETSKNKRLDFERHYPEYKTSWLAYADACKEVSTMEDFLKEDFISSELIKYDSKFNFESTKNAIQNIERAVNKDKEKKQEVKNKLIKNLKKDNIKDSYGVYLSTLKEKLEKLK